MEKNSTVKNKEVGGGVGCYVKCTWNSADNPVFVIETTFSYKYNRKVPIQVFMYLIEGVHLEI